ncbi:hypothetical protein OTU49_012583 [Cherax quadricarinatus]|uniref:NACHT domain-containing protein n=1 Tax=Cherax quadricarinatus TaxID=27406 RepID=A0AAW0VYA5_CHEQU
MASEKMEKDIRDECIGRLAELGTQRAAPGPFLGAMVAPPPGGEGGGKGRDINLEDLLCTKRVDDVPARVWVLSAEAGKGKSTIARRIATSWTSSDHLLHGLDHYQALLVLSGSAVAADDCWEAVKTFLLQSVSKWGASCVAEWMESAQVLVIIDDFIPKKAGEELTEALTEWTQASFLLLTTSADGVATSALTAAYVPTVHITLQGLDRCDALSLAMQHLPAEQVESFTSWLVASWCLVSDVLSYPRLVISTCLAWTLGNIDDSVVTTTQLLWCIVESQVSQCCNIREEEMARWLLVLGKLARRSLESEIHINREELLGEAGKIFPSGVEEVALLLPLPLSTSAACLSSLSFPHPLTQFLAAWDAIHQNMRGTPMKSLVKRLRDEDSVVIYAAGHLNHILQHDPHSPDNQVSRAAKNLVLHMDRATDRFGYTLKVIQEFRVHPRVLRIMMDEVGLPKIWEVSDGAVLVEPLAALLQHSTPVKIHVSVERKCLAPDLGGVVALLAGTSIPMFLAEMNHLQWGSSDTTDNLVSVIQRGNQQLQDFIGCLNAETIKSLCGWQATRNLVCLRVRVTDRESVEAILRSPSELPSLLWLEVDFDLPLDDLNNTSLTPVNTPLMDVCFRDITDRDVPLVCQLLEHIRIRYSGVHLMCCSLTPQGVREILKYFYRRGMYMTADASAIARYRRWRFPALDTVPKTETLTDDKVQHLLGYDDRYHYSDNEARTSVLATRLEANTLANFFEALQDLVYFRFVCANLSVVKNTDGTTEVKDLLGYQ